MRSSFLDLADVETVIFCDLMKTQENEKDLKSLLLLILERKFSIFVPLYFIYMWEIDFVIFEVYNVFKLMINSSSRLLLNK